MAQILSTCENLSVVKVNLTITFDLKWILFPDQFSADDNLIRENHLDSAKWTPHLYKHTLSALSDRFMFPWHAFINFDNMTVINTELLLKESLVLNT